jgi:hypothetical protein
MDTIADLTPWDMPFAEARDPSVSLITEHGGDVASIIVAPHGIDQYPKYLVRFDKVLAVLCYEEALALDRGYPGLPNLPSSVCAYLWADSPWLRASRGRAVDFLQWPDLQHYLIFGGDSIVELLASGAPYVERIDERRVLEAKHEV